MFQMPLSYFSHKNKKKNEYIQQQKCHNFTITIIYKIRFIVILWANRTFKMF